MTRLRSQTIDVLGGGSLLRAIRRGAPLQQVAKATGLAQGYISDIESRRRTGTAETLREIARALDVDASWLGA